MMQYRDTFRLEMFSGSTIQLLFITGVKFIDDNRRVCGLRLRIKKAVYDIYKTACTMLPCRTYLNVEVLEMFFEIAILINDI